MKVIWSNKARDDLNRIADRIARDKTSAAFRWVQTMYRKVLRLGHFPKSGRVVPELKREEVREILIDDYRVIYKVEKKTVSILTIFHGAKILSDLD